MNGYYEGKESESSPSLYKIPRQVFPQGVKRDIALAIIELILCLGVFKDYVHTPLVGGYILN